ncbi:hypothetical protein B0H66DRAFT_535486 [Apodospora peruviana]|uniref:Uncharacterized protein n=1 Tax=Apodospora peruviana TaxID=516989 RepID=A0AAE0HX99_9PEZI|nr:hypothetical protein B0H66DRAFT_535486 [Apodospora peruviana]
MRIYTLLATTALLYSAAFAWQLAMYRGMIKFTPYPGSPMQLISGTDGECHNFGDDLPGTDCVQMIWEPGATVPTGPYPVQGHAARGRAPSAPSSTPRTATAITLEHLIGGVRASFEATGETSSLLDVRVLRITLVNHSSYRSDWKD